MTKVITRFAPSPTGTLHIGGVRTALFNYVYAKQNDGLFLVRIEDTDKDRSTKEFEKNILDSLSSIGLSPDKEPINQSERNDIYVAAAEKIIASGKGYWCDCSKETLDEMRKDQEAAGKKPMYDGRSRNLGLERSENTVLRLATPEDGEIVVKDLIRGEVMFQNSELDDLILLRSDGTPTYHLCNVVDDYEQNVSTVIRGEDHLSNTPRQIHIQNALGYPSLEYAHLPLVLGPDKKRLSKRHAATSLEEYKAEGYLDSAILNTLARLGWSKGDQEVFYMEDLIKNFNINEVQKAGAIFDITKLDWLNSQHLSNLSLEDFKNHEFYFSDERYNKLLLSYKARYFSESLTANERSNWLHNCGERLTNQELGYLTLSQQQTEIDQLLRDGELSTESRKILNELENWSQQIAEKFALDDLKNSRL